ncbi:MAG TPA: glycoside hydrolase family 130 protein [Allosphingosinicella sp.]|nr:glycoside hydrolase family 130 protein [Allosphingosinicella sp.]
MIFRHPLRLHADPARVVIRPFHLAWQAQDAEPGRARRLVEAVMALDTRNVRAELGLVFRDFETRHWQTREVFLARFEEVAAQVGLQPGAIGDARKQLIGAYFCHEYSYAAAALMNPSIVPHPDQSGMTNGARRIILSLRAVGEGHISTVAFREGVLTPKREFELMPQPPFATAATCSANCASSGETPVAVRRHPKSTLSGTVIFPVTEPQRHGLEDLRLVQFGDEEGGREWLGTYTAYSGRGIRSEMMRTKDFKTFRLVPLTGEAAGNKGMALFPRRIGGRYAMIGRQDGENIFLHFSDRLDHWEAGQLLLKPHYPWELVQIGNCGSPVELDEGWLVLTHGVGAMRKYSIGAVLLDKDDPSRVLGRTPDPILSSLDHEREGYVPNVVYSCGATRIADDIFLPYGVADSSVAFAFMSIRELLAGLR